jgi:hypothetical protein
MDPELRQTESLDNLLEAISRWDTIATALKSEAIKIMVAEHTEYLKQRLTRHVDQCLTSTPFRNLM